MKVLVCIGLFFVAFAATRVLADEEIFAVTLPVFPYCPCIQAPSAYSLAPNVESKGNNTYCFTVVINPPVGCTTPCCTTADLKKLEMDVNPACKVTGQTLAATVNGKRVSTVPTIEKSVDKSTNSFIYKVTNLGLDINTANGAEICIYLGPNRNGDACTSLEALCKPPEGSPAGVCRTALFDSKVDCCPITDVPKLSPPPPPPPPPPCKTCAYVNLAPPTSGPADAGFNADICEALANAIIYEITEVSKAKGAVISVPFKLEGCNDYQMKVCGEYASDAEGEKVKADAEQGVINWLNWIAPGGTCPRELDGYTVVVSIGGDGPDGLTPPPSCVEAFASVGCEREPPKFPNCSCITTASTTAFAPSDLITVAPGRNENTTLYCFGIQKDAPLVDRPVCRSFKVLSKVEFYANETMRRKVVGVALRAAGAAGYRYLSPSWGAIGESTLKASPINWTADQANGAEVCLELVKEASLTSFCNGRSCWFTLFDSAKKCCPLYRANMLL